MNKVIVINLMGVTGSCKSTVASGIFYELKKQGINCELALEFAKDKVWEEAFRTMDDQIYIFAKQYHKLWRLRDKVDVIITDSPLLVSMYYNKTPSKYFDSLVFEQFNQFDNMTYFIKRGEHYQQEGRIQTEDESKQIDIEMMNILNKYEIDYTEVDRAKAVNNIVNDTLHKLINNHQ